MMKAASEGRNLLHSVLPESTVSMMELEAGTEVDAVGGTQLTGLLLPGMFSFAFLYTLGVLVRISVVLKRKPDHNNS